MSNQITGYDLRKETPGGVKESQWTNRNSSYIDDKISGPRLTVNNNQQLHDESNYAWLYDRLDEPNQIYLGTNENLEQ
jgi:hypothetical protein